MREFLEKYSVLAHKTSRFNKNEIGYIPDMHLLMCTLGIIGEYGEFITALYCPPEKDDYLQGILSESGDVVWYISELANWADCSLYSWYEQSLLVEKPKIFDRSFFAESVKKYVFHNKNHTRSFLEMIPCLLKQIIDTMYVNSNVFTLTRICMYNIEKLQSRYGDKFDGDKSLNRVEYKLDIAQ